jgi:cation diffusion facilitator CzcD-associated flavoprotein CzcO
MSETSRLHPNGASNVEHFDVLIVGAGISGIGAVHHLREQCPGKSFAILETKESFGGTWRTHTYPGIRSDSDLYTFGYRFKPWTGKPVAQADMILDYMEEAITEEQIDEHIRYQHTVSNASWSSDSQRWVVDVINTASGESVRFSCNFLWMCQGYYRHSEGYTPQFKGVDDFKGTIVHPQTWPENLDYQGKRVIVIGSGATAATLIPNMSDECSHITMLQRSPTYFWTGANRNELADNLRDLEIPEAWIHEIVRRSLLKEQREIQELSASHPEMVKEGLLSAIREHVGEDFDIGTHFTPSYRPWQQRIAYVLDGDLFKSIASGKVTVVTDGIDRLTEKGILTLSGQELEADIIVTATGFNLSVMGDINFDVDGEAVDFGSTFTYRGIMNSGVPNMAAMFGYFRTSWTMRVDLVSDFVCRLLNHMDSKDALSCTPMLSKEEAAMQPRPWIEPEEFNPGYMQRGLHLLPNQGDREPWVLNANYFVEKDELPAANLDDGSLLYKPR